MTQQQDRRERDLREDWCEIEMSLALVLVWFCGGLAATKIRLLFTMLAGRKEDGCRLSTWNGMQVQGRHD
jgi:hypothetical protein